MVFTTTIFTFGFLPVCLLVYFLSNLLEKKCKFINNMRLKLWALLLFSLGFYSFFKISTAFWIVAVTVGTYFAGLLISKIRIPIIKRIIMIVSVLGVVSWLVLFKYFSVIYKLFDPGSTLNLIAPLGISFIVFSSISYIVDVYRDNDCCGGFLDTALYISFFPKVVSGPIVLWREFGSEIKNITPSVELAVQGINRLAIGFAKKIIISDTIGLFVSNGISNLNSGMGAGSAWLCMFLYFLQIYTDFSSYSDISIGLSNIFGINIKENFSFPYIATSITDFWRRWHISLGTWFKEYIYKPLGGSRCGKFRTVLNIFIVFLITGIWHGCGVLYILWGLMHGVCRIFEFVVGKTKAYIKTPNFIKWIFTTAVVMFGWIAFMLPNVDDFTKFVGYMFGAVGESAPTLTLMYFSNTKLIMAVVFALLGSYVFALKPVRSLNERADKSVALFVVKEVMVLSLLVLSIVFMVNSTYSPFIYFQF